MITLTEEQRIKIFIETFPDDYPEKGVYDNIYWDKILDEYKIPKCSKT